jgi:glycerol uptake facilitator-like aquaporin
MRRDLDSVLTGRDRFGIGACFGWETGYAINLARDFGPRLVSYMLGYGTNVWRAGNYYFVSASGPVRNSHADMAPVGSNGRSVFRMHLRWFSV